MDVVVIGAGLAGLATGLQLARTGHDVTLLENDGAGPPASSAEAFTAWSRPGTPHARLHHTFLARARCELAHHLPEVVERLLELGAVERDLGALLADHPQPDDDELKVVCARRPTVEWVLRREAEATPGLRLVAGTSGARLVLDTGVPPSVAGVRADGDTLTADVVVDAGGRRSPVRTWLEEAEVRIPPVRREPCGIAYSSRYFRLRDGVDFPTFRGPVIEQGGLGFMGYAMGPADAGAYSVLFAFPADDRRLRVLRHRAAWDAAAAMIERTSVFVDEDVGEPLIDPLPMYGLENTIRPWFDDGRPLVRGLVSIGDAWSTTDPLFGWGASFALAHGFGLSDALEAHGADVDSALAQFHAAYEEEVEQRFALSCRDDRARLAHWHVADAEQTPEEIEQEALLFGLGRLARREPAALRAMLRRMNLLDLPDDVWADHGLVKRMRAAEAEHPFDPDHTTPEPDRTALLERIDAAMVQAPQ